MKVILDTNFLMIPAQPEFDVDIYPELERVLKRETLYELATISCVIEEIGALGQEGAMALELIKNNNVNIYEIESTNVDQALLDFATPGDFLCTQDGELKRRAKEKGIRLITMVKESHLEEV